MTEIIIENHTMITITNMMTHTITKDVESVVFLVTCLALTEITPRVRPYIIKYDNTDSYRAQKKSLGICIQLARWIRLHLSLC
jgi:hypothetical protein